MNVGELEELLAYLPADMPVYLAGGDGCKHITRVDKQDRRQVDPDLQRAWHGVEFPDDRAPAALVLRTEVSAPLWLQAWADDVPYEVTGRWPAKALR